MCIVYIQWKNCSKTILNSFKSLGTALEKQNNKYLSQGLEGLSDLMCTVQCGHSYDVILYAASDAAFRLDALQMMVVRAIYNTDDNMGQLPRVFLRMKYKKTEILPPFPL